MHRAERAGDFLPHNIFRFVAGGVSVEDYLCGIRQHAGSAETQGLLICPQPGCPGGAGVALRMMSERISSTHSHPERDYAALALLERGAETLPPGRREHPLQDAEPGGIIGEFRVQQPRNLSMEIRRCAVDLATPSSAAASLTRSTPSRFSINSSRSA